VLKLSSMDRKGWGAFQVGFIGLAVVHNFIAAINQPSAELTPLPIDSDPEAPELNPLTRFHAANEEKHPGVEYNTANTKLYGYLCMSCSSLTAAAQICAKFVTLQDGHSAYTEVKAACIGNMGVETFESILNLAHDLHYRVHEPPMDILTSHYGLYQSMTLSMMELPTKLRDIRLAMKVQFLRFLKEGHKERFDYLINSCMSPEVTYEEMYTKIVAQVNSEQAGEEAPARALIASRNRGKVPQSSRDERNCYNCGGVGHYRSECPSPARRKLGAPVQWGEGKP